MEFICRAILQNKSPDSDEFISELYQRFKEERMPGLHKCFQIIEEEGIFLTISTSQHYTDTKTSKDILGKKKLLIHIPHEHQCKNSEGNVRKSN